ncbi:hypothetical protein PoB_005505100 [Plakobranchus ocellatus]|uniref:RNase H type-1 domain-containing protein n=1 Tax=Plakobranchus ocellatus TaxID=259542 RepID=A0AAV4CB37_9GAST|nr:hypothetical protein PoB_005505100 [Plakobranchus ocellatus]
MRVSMCSKRLLDKGKEASRSITTLTNSVRERTRILQKLAGTNWGATPQSLRTIYVSFIRPVLEYANPVLNLASQTSLGKLDRVQNAALRLVLGALRSTPIAILELETGCEPLGLRRGEQTVYAQERYLRTGEGAPSNIMVEDFATQQRRIKKASVLNVVFDLSRKYSMPTDRAPLPVPTCTPETPPPVTSLYIGPIGRKDETCPLAMRALALETIARFGRECAIAYTDGSSTGGTGNGGYGIYFLWPDGSTTRKCGPVGEWTCSYECELTAVTECLRVVIEKQREGAALPSVVILTDCRPLEDQEAKT